MPFQKITVPVQGVVMVQLKDIINTMVDKLGQFAKEVTRVSQEVGTEGPLYRKGHEAVAPGDLSKQIEVDARGEILDLKNAVNGMVVRLRAAAAQVTRVTFEVGSQGKLRGQAHVPDIEGVWFELVRDVNSMYSSLMDQVHSIANVTTPVACGDLTQKIEMSVEGEMSTLKGYLAEVTLPVNTMAGNLTTQVRGFVYGWYGSDGAHHRRNVITQLRPRYHIGVAVGTSVAQGTCAMRCP
ncbi:hypothetical protein DXG01_009770 [Tephrocybe rancida]|nr:hypothetical protein DXG01_009770 [Tephrocybe rancida]